MPVRSLPYLLDVLTALVGRELRIRYKGSMLGLLWAVLSPLGTVLILHILFSQILPLNIPHYASFIYSGLLPWTWFQTAIQTSATTLFDNRDLVRKPFFPRPVLPAVVATTNFMLYLLALPVLILLLVAEGVPLSLTLLYLPIIWLIQIILTLAGTVLIAALGVIIRDVQHMLGVGMLLWFYLTPVFYDLNRIAPDKAQWFALNPLAVIVQAHRDVILEGRAPQWGLLGIWTLVGVVALALSLWLFRVLEDTFVEEV
jgi:lipopolysaccharide transport system permease protein